MFDEEDVSAIDSLLAPERKNSRVANMAAASGRMVRTPALYGQPVRLAPSMGYMLASKLPRTGASGSVVCVRTARGQVSAAGGQGLFTAWTDGQFLEVPAELLREARSGKYDPVLARRVANLDEVVGREYALSAGSPKELIHKATRDLWAFQQVDGGYHLCRLFNHDGRPLRV
jgi:hypothetical protein